MAEHYKPWISAGNILTVIMIALGGIGVYVSMTVQQARAEERVLATQVKVMDIDRRVDRLEHRITNQLDAMHGDIREIRRAMLRAEE